MNVIEVFLVKYDHTVSSNPNEGEAIWGRIISFEEKKKKEKAIYRLASIVKASDPEYHDLVMGDTLEIWRERKHGAFNQTGEVVYTKDISGNNVAKKLHNKAGQRLARYLSKINKEYNYYCRVEWVGIGRYGYQVGWRHTEILSVSDKELIIKRKITGRKSALTRSINKAKAVREEYRTSLFPEAYTTDIRYMRLLKYLPAQRKRLHEAKRMVPDDIEDVTGSIQEISRASLENMLKKMAA